MQRMKEFIEEASKAYYEGNPIISDATFDTLFATYNGYNVGYHVKNGIPHYERMYSLQKCYDLDSAPIPPSECVITPKLDGLAVSALYVEGKFTMGLTRGDGNLGHDITSKLAFLLPESIPQDKVTVQICGEVVALKSIANSRNYAAGTMNLKGDEEFKTRLSNLEFIAYDMTPIEVGTYRETLKSLEDAGFTTVLLDSLEDKYPTDGKVYRVDSNVKFTSLGFTSHHPRGSFAYKVQAEAVVTTLLDVKWQVGRSGVVSPVAILEPVEIGGATVSRATLHNPAFIENLNLEIGCKVKVVRSGEIIPCILERAD